MGDLIERLKEERQYHAENDRVGPDVPLLDETIAHIAALEQRLAAIVNALGVGEDVEQGRDIVEAAQSVKRTADVYLDETLRLHERAELAEQRLAAVEAVLAPLRELDETSTRAPWRHWELVIAVRDALPQLLALTSPTAAEK